MNNLKKKTLKSVAVIVSFVLISLTVSAQNFWKEFFTNNSFSGIAEAMTTSPEKQCQATVETKAISPALFTEYINSTMGSSLEAGSWMSDEPDLDGQAGSSIKPLNPDEIMVGESNTFEGGLTSTLKVK